MSDTRIALDYLQDLFEKLSAEPRRLVNMGVDWPFALEAWRSVCGEIEHLRRVLEQLRGEIEQLRHDNSHAGLRALYQRALKERDQARMERDEQSLLRREQVTGREPQPVPQWLLHQHNVRLRPCPFCEAADVQLVSLGSASSALDMSYFIQCEKCSARGPITLFSQKAVLGWNHALELRDEWECRGQNR